MNNNIVQEIYSRNYGSVNFYHRNYYKSLIYTEGILDFQQTLKAYWFVDWVIVNMKNVIATYKANDDGFFVITIKFNKQKHCILEIFREGFMEGNYCEHITVIKEKVYTTNLPIYDNYKFYLILSNPNPIQFTLLITTEY